MHDSLHTEIPVIEDETGETVELLASPLAAQMAMDAVNRRASENGYVDEDGSPFGPFHLGRPTQRQRVIDLDDLPVQLPTRRRRFARVLGL